MIDTNMSQPVITVLMDEAAFYTNIVHQIQLARLFDSLQGASASAEWYVAYRPHFSHWITPTICRDPCICKRMYYPTAGKTLCMASGEYPEQLVSAQVCASHGHIREMSLVTAYKGIDAPGQMHGRLQPS